MGMLGAHGFPDRYDRIPIQRRVDFIFMSETTAREFCESASSGAISRRRSILGFVAIALFVQMQFLMFTALCWQEGPLFVEKHPFGLDFYDFMVAANDWMSGRNPYLNVRFNKPPVTLLLGVALHPLGTLLATYVFFFANIAIVGAALWWIGRRLGLGRAERWLLLAIASMYYPFHFLVERGNLDGLMLGLTAVFLCSENRVLRAVALALSINLKVYTGLLLVPLVVRRWREAAAVVVVSLLMVLPFARLVLTSIQMIRVRGVLLATSENLSPGGFLARIGQHHPGLRMAYSLVWLASYGAMMYRRRGQSFATLAVLSLAWMVALPVTVISYTGVMLLPVLVLRIWEMALAETLSWVDKLFLAGFLLTGTQQYALFEYFGAAVHSHALFPAFNYLGTLLLLISLVVSRGAGEAGEGSTAQLVTVEASV
jgi:hypothetical protein